MAFDGILTHNLAKELNETLAGFRLDKIQQPSRYELLLTFSNRGLNKLYISTNPSSPNCHLSDLKFDNPQVAPRFTMFLRKHLQGARVRKVYCPRYERIIIIDFAFIDDFSETTNLSLVVELLTGSANVILLDEEGIIKDALFFSQLNDKRIISPKFPYSTPESQNKPLPEKRIEEIENSLELLKNPNNTQITLKNIDCAKSLDKELIKLSLGISPQIVNEVLHRSGISGKSSLNYLELDEFRKLLESAKEVLEECVYYASAYVYTDSRLKKSEYHCIKLASLIDFQEVESLSHAINYIHKLKSNAQALDQKRRQLHLKIRKELNKSKKLLNNYYKDIKSNENFEKKRLIADMLLSQLHSLPKSMPSDAKVTLINYYDKELSEIEVKLNPKLHMEQQAPYFYKMYSKSKDTYTYAQNHIGETQDLIEYLNTLLTLVESADNLENLDAIETELRSGPLKHKFNVLDGQNSKKYSNSKKGKKQKKKNSQSLAPQEYESSNGFKILAGRNNLQNDKLTFSNPNKEYLWFHAKNKPGTHVILQGTINEVEEKDIKEAAEIAAWLSLSSNEKKLANMISIDIDFCPLKNVKKPSGANPGFVIYDSYNTIRADAMPHEELKK